MSKISQSPSVVLTIQPKCFAFDEETASTNAFQNNGVDPAVLKVQARIEHTDLRLSMLKKGVSVISLEGSGLPDEMYLNNWFSTHDEIKENGKKISVAVIYPMLNDARRAEVRDDLVAAFNEHFDKVIDLRHYEKENKALEGTGSMVLDRVSKIAYAAISPRTDMDVLNEFCSKTGYEKHAFDTHLNGKPIYHANVMMWIGTDVQAACFDVIKNPAQKEAYRSSIKASGREIIELSAEQLNNMAGNAFEVTDGKGRKCITMSKQAYESYTPEQLGTLEKHYGDRVIYSDLALTEKVGGGSYRCAEVALHTNKPMEELIGSIKKHCVESLLPSDPAIAKGTVKKVGEILLTSTLERHLNTVVEFARTYQKAI